MVEEMTSVLHMKSGNLIKARSLWHRWWLAAQAEIDKEAELDAEFKREDPEGWARAEERWNRIKCHTRHTQPPEDRKARITELKSVMQRNHPDKGNGADSTLFRDAVTELKSLRSASAA
jgi:hypothetical protein